MARIKPNQGAEVANVCPVVVIEADPLTQGALLPWWCRFSQPKCALALSCYRSRFNPELFARGLPHDHWANLLPPSSPLRCRASHQPVAERTAQSVTSVEGFIWLLRMAPDPPDRDSNRLSRQPDVMGEVNVGRAATGTRSFRQNRLTPH